MSGDAMHTSQNSPGTPKSERRRGSLDRKKDKTRITGPEKKTGFYTLHKIQHEFHILELQLGDCKAYTTQWIYSSHLFTRVLCSQEMNLSLKHGNILQNYSAFRRARDQASRLSGNSAIIAKSGVPALKHTLKTRI